MFKEESLWIKKTLNSLDDSLIHDVLDVGSSTRQFRTEIQPHIHKNVFSPLQDKGMSISYMDKKNEEGIDYVVDVESINAKKIGKTFDLVICCSLLEHVKNPNKVCSFLTDLTKKRGFLLVTVPNRYRYHNDPIDSGFRPSMKKLISMFPGMKIIKKKVVHIKDKEKYKLPSISEAIKYIIPALNWKVICLLMRKTE
jgi:2-polyprenyl-3-methyl-5-hydroxy-6-metoxy-1,4-benzoquinol methylase